MGATAFAAILDGIPFPAAVGPISIYVADTTATFARRAIGREAILTPHRSHTYQRLAGVGRTHGAAALTVTAFTLTASVAGLLPLVRAVPDILSTCLIAVTAGVYLSLPRLSGASARARAQGPPAAPGELD